jgi:hypothetical protein
MYRYSSAAELPGRFYAFSTPLRFQILMSNHERPNAVEPGAKRAGAGSATGDRIHCCHKNSYLKQKARCCGLRVALPWVTGDKETRVVTRFLKDCAIAPSRHTHPAQHDLQKILQPPHAHGIKLEQRLPHSSRPNRAVAGVAYACIVPASVTQVVNSHC